MVRRLVSALDVAWLATQVGLPLLAPLGVAIIFAHVGLLGFRDLTPQWSIMLELTPRALTIYNLVLVCSTMAVFWPKLSSHAAIGIVTILWGAWLAVFQAFTVIWQHLPDYKPDSSIYVTSMIFTVVTVALCHWCATRR